MKMKWSIVGLVILGLVAALCASVLITLLRGGRQSGGGPGSEVEAVVAVKALPAMTVVDASQVTTRMVRSDEAPPDYVHGRAQVIGKALLRPMAAEQVFTNACFVSPGSGEQVAAAIPNGMRAVSVSLPQQSGLEPVLYPGAVVDVTLSFNAVPGRSEGGGDAVATTLLQKIQVLGVEHETIFSADKDKAGQPAASGQGKDERRLVTLMVDPAQARALQLAVDHGTISLTMRNPLDPAITETKPILVSELFKGLAPPAARVARIELPMVLPAPPSMAMVEPVPAKVEPASAKVEPAPAKVEPPKVKAPPPTPKWEVLIIRGGSRETVNFDLKQEKPVAPK